LPHSRQLNPALLGRGRAQALVDVLAAAGYAVYGPRVRGAAVVLDRLADASEMPWGVLDHPEPGRYVLGRGDAARCFAWNQLAQGLKPLVFAPREVLWSVERSPDGRLRFQAARVEPERVAVIGVRACDLAGLALLDRHFLGADGAAGAYAARRASLFIVGVDCARSASTCFCASTGDGPALQDGYDIGLSEVDAGFLVWAGSDAGAELVARLPLQEAGPAQLAAAAEGCSAAAGSQTRGLPSRHLARALFRVLDHEQWQAVARRCLGCGSCTAVCPTCFCHALSTEAELDGSRARQVREWDSCFGAGHSLLHGSPLRADRLTRYRQWLTHKLGAWHEQYGRSGCVGCGRCIAWCPVGIDLTAEVEALVGDSDYE
jgi:ferredoxin